MKGAVSRRLTEDCVLRSKTYEVNTASETLFISYISLREIQSSAPVCELGHLLSKGGFLRIPVSGRQKKTPHFGASMCGERLAQSILVELGQVYHNLPAQSMGTFVEYTPVPKIQNAFGNTGRYVM